MTIIKFLEARIAEDEAEARLAIEERAKATPDAGPDAGFQSWPDSPVPAVLVGPERVLAECAAKRAMIKLSVNWDGYTRNTDILRTVAGAYADHPDYQQEWTQ